MRLAALLLLVACGDNRIVDRIPDGPGPDAFVLPPCENPVAGTEITIQKRVELVAEDPLLVTSPLEDPRLFVVTRDGRILIVENDQVRPAPFIDIATRIISGGERGLLGLAFHPQYAQNRRFFIYYTRPDADPTFSLRDVVARCEASDDPDVADPTSCVEVLAIKDLRANHNGGMIEFGLDGMLYIGTGDGGGSGDPPANAQSLTDGMPTSLTVALMGKLLRIDVDHEEAGQLYAIPAGNPFPNSGVPEVYALGLRNPWRWSFDRGTGDLWIGDVGQGVVEEIDFVPAAEIAGTNFGWDVYEANNCFTGPCVLPDVTFPVSARTHAAPDLYTAIIGGQVYRGTCFPDLVGTYFYADNLGAQYAKISPDMTVTDLQPRPGETFPNAVSSIHADARGELWVTTLSGNNLPGTLHRIEVHP